MRLDRNTKSRRGGKPSRGKYALIRLRQLPPLQARLAEHGGKMIECYVVPVSAVVWGDEPETEFFAIMLRDAFAAPALYEYAAAAAHYDKEYAQDVQALAHKASRHRGRKVPD